MREARLTTYRCATGVESRADALVERHADLVRRIAHHLLGRLPAHVELDDLVQSGMIGLLEAAQKYDPGKGASFETYAGIRIRGAMLDEVRRGDWAPRSVHRNARRVAAAIRAVERRTARAASDAEIAAELDVTVDVYHTILSDAAGARLFSFEELSIDEATGERHEPAYAELEPGPADSVARDDARRAVACAIGALPEREQLVLSLYYDEELNLKEIGTVLGVTESRVSQILTQATLRLRSRVAGDRGG